VIELMGGVTDAKDVVFKAIAKGKHVITANKALLAQHLPEIQALLKQVHILVDESASRVSAKVSCCAISEAVTAAILYTQYLSNR
jgi:homoserine dehydrogenase